MKKKTVNISLTSSCVIAFVYTLLLQVAKTMHCNGSSVLTQQQNKSPPPPKKRKPNVQQEDICHLKKKKCLCLCFKKKTFKICKEQIIQLQLD